MNSPTVHIPTIGVGPEHVFTIFFQLYHIRFQHKSNKVIVSKNEGIVSSSLISCIHPWNMLL